MTPREEAALRTRVKREIRRAGLPVANDASAGDLKKLLLFVRQYVAMADLIAENQQAWEGEEDSVQREHRELIRKNGVVLRRFK